jgi:hypothetical protein
MIFARRRGEDARGAKRSSEAVPTRHGWCLVQAAGKLNAANYTRPIGLAPALKRMRNYSEMAIDEELEPSLPIGSRRSRLEARLDARMDNFIVECAA